MTGKPLVVATRRLPRVCEDRLRKKYAFREGDDGQAFSAASLATHAKDASALIVTPTEKLDADAFDALPNTVKIVATFSVGYEHIDLEAAKARKIKISNTPGVLTEATADLTLLLILAATRRAYEGLTFLRSGNWDGIRPTQMLGSQITGKRLGIIGLGRIGAAVAQRAEVFGMEVCYHNRRPASSNDGHNAQFIANLDEMLGTCDVLSLHCPLTPETNKLLDTEKIARLKDGVVVINTARGGLIDDDALIAALKSKKVSAAGLDVFANEPQFDQRYLAFDNVFLLPHLGSATTETRTAMGMIAVDCVEAVLDGKNPPYLVD